MQSAFKYTTMFYTSFRIYVVTNALFLAAFAICLFPEGLAVALIAAPFSLIFSFPLIFLLLAVIFLLNKFCPSPVASWLVFLASVAGMTYLPLHWFDISFFESGENRFFCSIAYISAFLSILILRKSIHKFFTPVEKDGGGIVHEPLL
jgi:hypothetical protein